jgi:hypothetical protein
MALKIKKGNQPAFYGSSRRIDTSNESPGMNNLAAGDYYGTGVRAKLGKIRTGTGIDANPLSSKKLRKPPKSVV